MKSKCPVLLVATLALALGCASKGTPNDNGGSSRTGVPLGGADVTSRMRASGDQTITASLTLPSGLTSAGFLVAQTRIQLDSNITVAGPVWSAGTLSMQPDVKVQAAVVTTGDVTLTDRDTITSLTYGGTLTRGNGDSIGTSTRASLTNTTNSTSITFPATSQSVTLNSGQSATLNPGSYVSVTASSGSTLTLLAGDYYVGSLVLESTSVLRLSPTQGATRIFIASTFAYRSTLGGGADASRLFVEYLGTNPVVLETPFWGSMVAPRASLAVGTANSQLHRGSFMAQSLEVQPNAKLDFVGFDPSGTTSSCGAGTWDPDGNPFTPCVAKTTCAAGSYVSAEGTTTSDRTCTACTSGQFSTVSNAPSCTVWRTCQAGTYVSNTPSSTADRVCVACPSGRYSSGNNQSQCLPQGACVAGTVQTAAGTSTSATVCTPCVAGQYCAGGTSPQTTCVAGTWDNDGNPATVCVAKTNCLAGSHVTNEGTTTTDRTCASCASGSFSTSSNLPSCTTWTTCFAGKYVTNTPSTKVDRTCQDCPPGQYSASNNQASCQPQGTCAAGYVQTASGTPSSPPICAACDPGQYCAGDTAEPVDCGPDTWDNDHSAATPCIAKTQCLAGQFVSSDGSRITDRVCAACASGWFSTATNAAACDPWSTCHAGWFVSNTPSYTADRACMPCPSGQYSSGDNQSSCLPQGSCDAGQYQTAAGTPISPTACADCVAGQYCAGGTSPPTTCRDGIWDDDSNPATACAPVSICSKGSYVLAEATPTTDRFCQPCEDGTFSAIANAASCAAWATCDRGKYVSNTPSASENRACSDCETGKYSSDPNAPACTTWTTCSEGYYVSNTPSATADRECTSCPDGQYSSGDNQSSCLPQGVCAAGRVQDTAGTPTSPTVCHDCVPGEYCAGGTSPELHCADDTWDKDGDPATACVDKSNCPAGRYVADEGSTTTDRSCTACGSEQFSTEPNSASCTPWTTCHAGTFVSNTPSAMADRVCTPCDPNTFSSADNAAACTPFSVCSVGTFVSTAASASNDAACARCAADTFANTTNAEACQPCGCAPGSDQCHGVCDPATGQCSDDAKPDGTGCNDGDACTQTDVCQQGVCQGQDPVTCPPPENNCQTAVCDSHTGTCSYAPIDKVGCNVFLRVDGVVEMGDDNWIAVFGWYSTATTAVHPTTNTVSVDTGEVPSTSPPPPAYLIPGDHPGGFLAHFKTDQVITWTVDSSTASASNKPLTIPNSSSTALTQTPLPTGGGTQVDIGGGTMVTITPDMDAYSTAPYDPTTLTDEPAHSDDAFNGALTGSLTTGPLGQAIYTVPISIPPGIAGMAPNLSLVYNSQSGDGIAGQGWSLGGLSTIYRCPKTRLADGYSKTVDMDDTSVAYADGDGICLDGQRLFHVSSTDPMPTFETELKDFSNITEQGDAFMVITKSGETRFYGLTEHSRVYFPNEDNTGIIPRDAGSAASVIAVWALEKVIDPWGNYFEIHYNEDKNTSTDQSDLQKRGLIVTEIKYTGHETAGRKDVDPFNSITLSYDEPAGDHPRADVRITRFRDSVLPMNSRLTHVTTQSGTYNLIYKDNDPKAPDDTDDPAPPTRLARIEYCAGTGDSGGPCLEPLQFHWKEGHYEWDKVDDYKSPATEYQTTEYKSNQQKTVGEGYGPGTQFVDLDGDGLPDFVLARAVEKYTADPKSRITWKNTGNGWQLMTNWQLPDFLAGMDGTPRGGLFVDIDNDGLPDFITDRYYTYCDETRCAPGTPGYPWGCDACSTIPQGDFKILGAPAVYLNKTRTCSQDSPTECSTDPSTMGSAWVKDPSHSDIAMTVAIKSLGTVTGRNGQSLANDWTYPNLAVNGDVKVDYMGDVDGDGRPDLVHFGKNEKMPSSCFSNRQQCKDELFTYRIDVLLNKESGWVVDEDYSVVLPGSELLSTNSTEWTINIVKDVNRDGLADIASVDPSDASRYDKTVFINTGSKGKGDYGSVWKRIKSKSDTMPWNNDGKEKLVNFADIDGDGQLDVLTQEWVRDQPRDDCGRTPKTLTVISKASAGTSSGWVAPWSSGYQSVLDGLQQWSTEYQLDCVDSGAMASGRFDIVDFNADGLADLYANGKAYINNGTTWVAVDGSIPAPGLDPFYYLLDKDGNPHDIPPLNAFFDLNGDGVPDRVDHFYFWSGVQVDLVGTNNAAWLNRYAPPVIDTFPVNGVATGSSVQYSVITAADAVASGVYNDDNSLPTGLKYFSAPVRVVSSVTSDNGVGSTSTVSYKYWNLRASAHGRGPQGFAKVEETDSATGLVTTTTYSQTYPYTGRPVSVTKDNHGPVTSTVTSYCYWLPNESGSPNCSALTDDAAIAAGKPVFVYPGKVTDTSYLRTSQLPETGKEVMTTTTEFSYDRMGNPISTTVTTAWSTGASDCSGDQGGTGGTGESSSSTMPANSCGETYQKKIANEYGDEGSYTQIHGKVTHMEVTSQKLAPIEAGDGAAITHKTDFEYKTDGTFGLAKRFVEKGSTVEFVNAFDYDQFGNLTISRECASDFDSCDGSPPGGVHPPVGRRMRPHGAPRLVQARSDGQAN